MLRNQSGHLWNAGLLVASVSVALAASRLSVPSPRNSSLGAPRADIAAFVAPLPGESAIPRHQPSIAGDPFDGDVRRQSNTAVAPGAVTPTVLSSLARGPSLSAILVADERRVAVVDDAAVTVGDVLKDGSKVSAIQPDRVWVVDTNGRWRMLTLTSRGQ